MPELDFSEVINRVAGQKILDAILSKPDEEWNDIALDKMCIRDRDMLGWPGICSRCGKPTGTQEAHKLCPACREASQRTIEIARSSRTEKNWFARTHSLMAWGRP